MTNQPKTSRPPIEIHWEDPPEKRGPESLYDAVIPELKARPNVWARIRVCASQSSAYSSAKQLKKNPSAKKIETRVVTAPDRKGLLYARYVPTARNGGPIE